ncbi:hypothetical protein H0I76_14375 [Limibaculum sp. M0105]|uniref:Uncharacterized protein n=1 Tax=Thermohalobaculum xanthum TaxID=2753746 RepID=A0A8J7M9W1_9RHOB|nr:hypothetical protein [Thermohalobaculum xanthum]MBK0400383.1 hypothetical protein [Thermohalobaculum xanthum]
MGAVDMSSWSGSTDRALAWLSARRARLNRIALAVALAIFVGGLVLSLRSSPDILEQARLMPLLGLVLLTLPMGLAINALDFQVMARMCGARVGFWPALMISVYSRAANMLPIPGSMAVRMGVLKTHGVTFRRGGGLIVLFTLIFGGVGFCYSASWLAVQAPPALAAGFGALGVALLGTSAALAHRAQLPWRMVGAVTLFRLGLVAVDALSLMIALGAVGVDVDYRQTAILVVAGFLSGAVPAGIGVREAVVAILAPIAGIDPAAGFLAASASRVTAMAFLAVCTGVPYAVLSRNGKNGWRL